MGPNERKSVLDRWTAVSSPSEKDRMDRAERMVRAAIDAHAAFDNTSIMVYAKGSYANSTNVRLDSDVDIVVENHDLFYFDYSNVTAPAPDPNHVPYLGDWTPEKWRTEVTKALTAAFGTSQVDTSGSVALTVLEVAGSRPSADVVPSFQYRQFHAADRSVAYNGSRVFTTSNAPINNWPKQQHDNGVAKNNATNYRYKQFVRALKSAENYFAAQGEIADLPSYFMECLMWNVPNAHINDGGRDEGFGTALAYLIVNLDGEKCADWVEPNGRKWLFKHTDKWTPEQGQELAFKTWQYLGYSA